MKMSRDADLKEMSDAELETRLAAIREERAQLRKERDASRIEGYYPMLHVCELANLAECADDVLIEQYRRSV